MKQGGDPQAELRREYRAALKAQREAEQQLRTAGVEEWWRHLPPFDWQRFARLTCGARTRAGTPCQQRTLYANGRCKLHGGLSTGPTTEAGKARAAQNGRLPKRTP